MLGIPTELRSNAEHSDGALLWRRSATAASRSGAHRAPLLKSKQAALDHPPQGLQDHRESPPVSPSGNPSQSVELFESGGKQEVPVVVGEIQQVNLLRGPAAGGSEKLMSMFGHDHEHRISAPLVREF